MEASLDRTLARSRSDRMIAGVLGGLAVHFGWSSQTLRIVFVLLSVLSAGFPGILVYLALWFLMPEEAPGERTFDVGAP